MTGEDSAFRSKDSDTRIRSVMLVSAAILIATGACNPSPSSDDGWPFGASDADPGDTSDVVTDTPTPPPDTPADTAVDTHYDTSTEGPWTGWIRWEPTRQTFMPDSHVENVTGEPNGSSVVGQCQVQIQPSSPAWLLEPAAVQTDFWRVRQPAATTGPTERPPLSQTRFGHVRVNGTLDQSVGGPGDTSVDGRIRDPGVELHTCDTLNALGRCGVPNAGDLCYRGIEPFASVGEPELSTANLPGEKTPADTTLDFEFYIDFAPRVADAGLDVGLQFTLPRFGPADGTLHDWTLEEVIDGTIQRTCSSWGRTTTADYPLSEATGWLRRIPARERGSDRNLIVVNLETNTGDLSSTNPRPDAGLDPPDCSNEPMELWFAVEYEN